MDDELMRRRSFERQIKAMLMSKSHHEIYHTFLCIIIYLLSLILVLNAPPNALLDEPYLHKTPKVTTIKVLTLSFAAKFMFNVRVYFNPGTI